MMFLQVCNVVKVGDVMIPIRVPDVAACALLESCPFHHTTNDKNDHEYEEVEGGNSSGDSLEGGSSNSTSKNKSEGTQQQPSKKKRKVR